MRRSGIVAVVVMSGCSLACASEWVPVGGKGLAMGGAQVAVPEGSQAMLVNPAGLARDERWDVALPVSATVGAEGSIITDADRLINSYNDKDASGRSVETAFDSLKNGSTNAAADIGKIVNFLGTDAAALDKPGQGVVAGVNGALTARVGRFGISAGQRVGAGAGVRYDSNFNFKGRDGASLIGAGRVPTSSISAAGSASAEATSIASAAAVSGSASNLSAAQVQTLTNTVTGSSGRALTSQESSLLGTIVKEINTSNAPGAGAASSLEINNNTGLDIKYLAIREVGLGYGMSFLENKLHAGAGLKVMNGETRVSSISLADSASEGKDLEDELTSSKNKKKSTTFGIDLGVLYDLTDRWTVGLTGRDLNAPEFDTVSGSKIEVDPTLRAGAAYEYLQKPGWRGVLAADADVMKSDSTVLGGSESQQVAAGISQELMGWLSLRAGIMKNLAGESDGVIYAGGLGFQIYKLYLDASVMSASEKVTVDGDDYPAGAGVGVTLGWNMNL